MPNDGHDKKHKRYTGTDCGRSKLGLYIGYSPLIPISRTGVHNTSSSHVFPTFLSSRNCDLYYSATVLSSATQTLESWVRIPLEAWICESAFFCVVLSCVGRGLASGRSAVP
jgi:hypothetical protein